MGGGQRLGGKSAVTSLNGVIVVLALGLAGALTVALAGGPAGWRRCGKRTTRARWPMPTVSYSRRRS